MKFLGVLPAFFVALMGIQECHSFQALPTSRRGATNSRLQTNTGRISPLASQAAPAKTPGSAQLDTPWQELGFEFRPTNSHVRITYKDGEWGVPELVKVSINPWRALRFDPKHLGIHLTTL